MSDTGTIPHHQCIWEKFVTPNKRQKIHFTFRNDASLEYVHDYETYIHFATGHTLKSREGTVFFVELKSSRNGVIFFEVIRNLLPVVPESLVSLLVAE